MIPLSMTLSDLWPRFQSCLRELDNVNKQYIITHSYNSINCTVRISIHAHTNTCCLVGISQHHAVQVPDKQHDIKSGNKTATWHDSARLTKDAVLTPSVQSPAACIAAPAATQDWRLIRCLPVLSIDKHNTHLCPKWRWSVPKVSCKWRH